MFIKEVTIDGFKSYAQKVTVRDFDRNFNAITGLNGSGKSNILDAICFVLGMRNLAKVRVNNLQELIYKQGQAGVTKAVVSIKFDNSDRGGRPKGYENCDEITVTRTIHAGKDQFLINSQKAQASRVQDMFHSVQLNVNNPHFLIMQGRITKVLNMKPIEILALLEEAAGTTMYNQKRDASLKRIEKKKKQLEEIDDYVANDLLPAMEALEVAMGHYTEWQEACAKFDTLDQVVYAYRFWRLCKGRDQRMASVDAASNQIEDCERQAAELEEEHKMKLAEIEAARNQQQLMSNGKVKEASERCDLLGIQVAKQQGVLESKSDDLKELTSEFERLIAGLEDISEDKLDKLMQTAESKLTQSAAAMAAADEEHEAAKCELAGAQSGDGRDETNRSLPERLRETESAIKQQKADAERAKLAIAHLQKDLQTAAAECKTKLQEDATIVEELAAAHSAVDTANQTVTAVPMDMDEVSSLERSAQQQRATVNTYREKCRSIAAGIGHILNFAYNDPRQGFDRRTVKGVLARLVRVKDPTHATALEVAAGGKLSHIVVDTDHVGRDLLKHGGLKRRVTLVPLNKTKARVVAPNKQQQAACATDGRATLALELVGYEHNVEVAMQHAFGNAFVCQDIQAAQKVAFSRDISCRGISLQGDDFSPAGTLTGGSRGKGTPLLARLAELQHCEDQLAVHQELLHQTETRLNTLSGARKQYQDAVQQLELAKHALTLVEGRAKCSAGHQAQQRVDELGQQLEEAIAQRDAADVKKTELETKAEELQQTIALFATDRGAVIKAAEKRVEKAKAALKKTQDIHAEKAEDVNLKKAELEYAAEERGNLKQKLDVATTDLEAAQEVAQTVEAELNQMTAEWREAEEEVRVLKEGLKQYNEDVNAAKSAASDIQQKLANILQTKAVQARKKEKNGKEADSMSVEIEKLETNPRLAKDKERLGQPGGRFDFDNMDMKQKMKEHEKAEEVKKYLEPRVNKNVSTSYETTKQTYNVIITRRDVVTRDKERIEEVIEQLDIKRDAQLEETWHKVSTNFSKIFATLLPGTEARLEPPEGCSFLDGLEVRVAFGGVWKQSLSELSGGQRSLLTLSLILSLLEFRPAPMYILDEVDAALDLSHTQNIGKLISERFPNAQFVIVSLKEGMFNNANVLFRTQFVNGSSTVQRTARSGHQRSGRQAAEDVESDEVRPTPAKRGRALTSRQENRLLPDI